MLHNEDKSLGEKIDDAVEEAKSRLASISETSREKYEKAINELQKKYEEGKKQFKEAGENNKEEAERKLTSLQEDLVDEWNDLMEKMKANSK